MTRFTFIVLFSLFFHSGFKTSVCAQAEVDERALIKFDEGLGFHAPDSSFGLNLRFRIQNRLGFSGFSDGNPSIEEIDARIRRLRLRIDGYTINKKITYYLQLSFSRNDQDWDNSGVPNIIRDAMVYYGFSENFYVGFGQGKLPGNRQRINSSWQLQFTDRSNVNSMFNIDRDFGIMSYYSNNISGFYYNLKAAVSSGEGRNAKPSDNGLAYTARIEMLPFGKFINNGDFSEGDLEREPSPKLSVGGGYHYNHKAIRTHGQRGNPLFEARNLETLFFDAVIKYRGWAFFAEYMDRETSDPLTCSPDNETSHVYTGYGINVQVSYLFKNNFELAGRYNFVRPDRVVSGIAHGTGGPGEDRIISVPGTDEYTIGVTRYLAKHKIKAQGNIGYVNTKDMTAVTASESKLYIQFQVELGI